MPKGLHKKFQISTMTKSTPPFVEREAPPKVTTEVGGTVTLNCPFCEIPHPLSATTPSPCGSLLRVTAVQNIYKSKSFPGMICAKCGETGGDMTKLNDGFLHIIDCKPGVKVMNAPPPFTWLAKFAFHRKDGGWLKKWFIKNIGIPQEVKELLPNGEQTGKVLGYVFYRSE